jgi:hypothetical protein
MSNKPKMDIFCIHCGRPWRTGTNPGYCRYCGKYGYGVAREAVESRALMVLQEVQKSLVDTVPEKTELSISSVASVIDKILEDARRSMGYSSVLV